MRFTYNYLFFLSEIKEKHSSNEFILPKVYRYWNRHQLYFLFCKEQTESLRLQPAVFYNFIQKSKSPFCKVQCLELVRGVGTRILWDSFSLSRGIAGLGVLFYQLFSPAITIPVTGGHLTILGLSFLLQKEKRLTR